MFKRTNKEMIELFFNLKTRQDVANILEIDDKSLRYFLFVKRPEHMYSGFTIKKRDGSERNILAPNIELRNIQRKLAYVLSLIYEPKVCAYGFIEGKSIVANAKNHVRKKLLLNIDLKDFFLQIHFGRIQGMLSKPPYGIALEAAMTISQIACYKGILPQGAPSSPIITNMICKPLDNQLMRLSKKYDMIYTRYVDDITFSTYKHEFPKCIVNGDVANLKIGNKLNSILENNSFTVNENKVFLNSSSMRQEVTGLIVNKFPNVKRRYTRLLRAILHNCSKKGIYQTALDYFKLSKSKNDNKKEIISRFKMVLMGKICFIKQVKGKDSFTYFHLANKMNELFKEKIFDLSSFDELINRIGNNVFVIKGEDMEEDYRQGSGFVLKDYGLVTSFHVTERNYTYKVYKYSDYSKENAFTFSKDKEICSDKAIDYALYDIKINQDDCFELGDSTKLKIRDQVIIAGYPNFNIGDSPYVQACYITSYTHYLGAEFYTVSGRIVHGASGGVVLDKNKRLVGIIKGGVVSITDETTSDKQGFVPIHLVIKHYKQYKKSQFPQ